MAYTITIGEFTWEPKRPVGQTRQFKADPSPWAYSRQPIKVEYADVAIFRDKGSSTRTIRVTGVTASDDRNEMLGELDAFTTFRRNGTETSCTITAGAEVYSNCKLMDIGAATIEPSADPLYHIAFELIFMQYDDGTRADLAAAEE